MSETEQTIQKEVDKFWQATKSTVITNPPIKPSTKTTPDKIIENILKKNKK